MSSRLIILGNGFDLAHGLKTSYGDFIKYIINESINYNEDIRKDLLDVGYLPSDYQSYVYIKQNFNFDTILPSRLTNKPIEGRIHFKNNFFFSLLQSFFEADWVDVESFYYQKLCSISSIKEVILLNEEFDIIKKYFETYLNMLFNNPKLRAIPNFIDIFYENNPDYLFILNFNYTPTISLYYNKLIQTKKGQTHIHGEINSPNNPIVFGYGNETDKNYNLFLENPNSSYLRNLKRQQYNLASSYSKLQAFLKDSRDIEIYSIGHSLGLSDKSLLKEVFDNPKTYKIKLFYYNNREGFRSLNDNISKIVNPNTLNNKIINFEESSSIPQTLK